MTFYTCNTWIFAQRSGEPVWTSPETWPRQSSHPFRVPFRFQLCPRPPDKWSHEWHIQGEHIWRSHIHGVLFVPFWGVELSAPAAKWNGMDCPCEADELFYISLCVLYPSNPSQHKEPTWRWQFLINAVLAPEWKCSTRDSAHFPVELSPSSAKSFRPLHFFGVKCGTSNVSIVGKALPVSGLQKCQQDKHIFSSY